MDKETLFPHLKVVPAAGYHFQDLEVCEVCESLGKRYRAESELEV